MSYKTIKRVLGETSLERKCRFLFGSGLLLLISCSFWLYAWQTRKLVDEQNAVAARLLVTPVILEKHLKRYSVEDEELRKSLTSMVSDLKPDDLKDYDWALLSSDPTADPVRRPRDSEGHIILDKIRAGQREVIKLAQEEGRNEYHYYGAVFARESCVKCHKEHSRMPALVAGDLIGMVRITFPLEKTRKALAWNNAILLATAIVTAFLAMLAAYSIVRYVIVKPVLHLKDVSEAISRGGMDMRADIRTGDEFEQLSHAFNRMLRHLVTVQEELQHVNRNLDAKVDELAQANLRLFELNNLKNEFLATMSHELRTPLNSILGFSDVLLGTASSLNDRQRRYVSNIQSSGRSLLSLINDVLDLAKIESGKMEVHPVEFSLADLIERMVGSMSPLAERKNLELGWDVAADLPPLKQDPGKIQQILNNLLSNAVKFTPEGGRVQVFAQRHGTTQFRLVVIDTGIGIPLEEQERIFEKFRQGRSSPGQQDTLTREYEGTGLGLSIVRELSRLLGGEISLESEFGRGSTFAVTLPLEIVPSAENELTPIPPTRVLNLTTMAASA